MKRLSTPTEEIKEHYDVVVVGSGYGGSISASRMARAGRSVCLLEKGKEMHPGEYPDKENEAHKEMQLDIEGEHVGSETGLYDFRFNEDINVFQGCGLGGTSLVNANVSLPPEEWVLKEKDWPAALREDKETLDTCLERARTMLQPLPYPENRPTPAKLKAMETASAGWEPGAFYRPPINVTFEDGINNAGVEQKACNGCGDCVTGCNYEAKNTTLMNYLPDAHHHGAEIFTEVAVDRLERHNDQWVVRYKVMNAGREKFGDSTSFVTADIVILGAGTLGTTEIMLRSKENGLVTSDKLGQRFTGNGDFLGFGYNNDVRANAIGMGHLEPDEQDPVGPCITGIIDLREEEYTEGRRKEGMVIEEGVIPGALSAFVPWLLSFAANVTGDDTDSGLRDFFREIWRRVRSMFGGAYRGAANNTMTYLVMTHDDGKGKLFMKNDRIRIDWDNVGEQSIFKKVSENLQKVTDLLGGTYVKNPTWNKLFKHRLTTVHPLGGCIMAEDAGRGVVNHKGQVFSGTEGTETYDGLYISDGAIIPRTLGVNPLLTISALAERNAQYIAEDRGWQIDYSLYGESANTEKQGSPETDQQAGSEKPGIQFTERMSGYFALGTDSYEEGHNKGEAEGSPFSFVLTIRSNDVEQLLENKEHQAGMTGSVQAPALSSDDLTVSDGIFNLFVDDTDEVNTHYMRYKMKLRSEEGKRYFFEGHKVIHDDPGFDMWSDTTTLYMTLYEGNDDSGKPIGKGTLHIKPADFYKQIQTIKVTGTDKTMQRLKYLKRFGQFFGGTLIENFGDSLAGQEYFDPDAPARHTRPLRTSEPKIHHVQTEDGVTIRLTRYKGGDKGPVILSHGLGVSSRIFSTDMIDTNLTEYLFEHGYDVWLLDYRASIELPVADTRFSADDIARYDYPAAVQKVLDVTGAEDVQMVVHCFGATSWTISMLAGWLDNVRSAVVSQVSTQMKVPFLTKAKTGLHVPSVLDSMGIDSLTAHTDRKSGWMEKLFDDAIQFYPFEDEEECNNPVCHRISFLYGHLYEHDQLNDLTHKHLHELFGVANIESFEHLAVMSRKGHVTNLEGDEAYMPYLERMAIPTTFISGAENQCFLPESTELTVNELTEKNGGDLYKRIEIPNYGHIDCIFGKNAHNDVFPHILNHLERTQS